MSAKPRSLLKLDQAYIAVGGREHLTLVRETDIMRTIVRRKSPPELQRCRLEHSICRDAEVPSSTQSALYLPLGLIRMRIEQIRESPLGLDPRAAELPICIPTWYAQNIPNGRERSPRIPLPPWPGY